MLSSSKLKQPAASAGVAMNKHDAKGNFFLQPKNRS
jgi:hypothetical protein